VDLEGHGREDVFDGVDLSRTVGWFTTLTPVRLDVGALDWNEVWAAGPAVGHALRRVKELLRRLPDGGLGYGMLRYLNADTGRALDGLARPQVGFNYLGRFPAAREAADAHDFGLVAGLCPARPCATRGRRWRTRSRSTR